MTNKPCSRIMSDFLVFDRGNQFRLPTEGLTPACSHLRPGWSRAAPENIAWDFDENKSLRFILTADPGIQRQERVELLGCGGFDVFILNVDGGLVWPGSLIVCLGSLIWLGSLVLRPGSLVLRLGRLLLCWESCVSYLGSLECLVLCRVGGVLGGVGCVCSGVRRVRSGVSGVGGVFSCVSGGWSCVGRVLSCIWGAWNVWSCVGGVLGGVGCVGGAWGVRSCARGVRWSNATG